LTFLYREYQFEIGYHQPGMIQPHGMMQPGMIPQQGMQGQGPMQGMQGKSGSRFSSSPQIMGPGDRPYNRNDPK